MDIRVERWHTLIVLDACRYDCFKQIVQPALKNGGRLERRWSPGSCTEGWIRSQCRGDFADTVYISANPFISHSAFETILKMPWPFGGEEPLWDWGWNDELGTVPPEALPVVVKRYPPGQRMIVHLMQPHHPFIIDGRRLLPLGNRNRGWAPSRAFVKGNGANIETRTEWDVVLDGRLSAGTVIVAYKRALAGTIPALQEIIEHRMEGTTVITADHGELFEPPYGHPDGSDHPDLRTVPWFVTGDLKEAPMAKKKTEKKITGKWYDHAYWETSQRGGKGGYDSIPSLDGLSREIAEQTTQVFNLKGKRMLDAGCGPGLMVARWRELGVEAYGIDWSAYALEGGAKIRPRVKEFCTLGSVTNLSKWPDGFFDVVRSTQVLEHIYPDEVPQVAAEFARVLAPGGMLLVDMPMCLPWEPDPRPDDREPSHFNIRPIEYWHEQFGKAGLRIWQDAVTKFITEAPVWRGVRWQMAAYYKPED